MIHSFFAIALAQSFPDQFCAFDRDHVLTSFVFALSNERNRVFERIGSVEIFRRFFREIFSFAEEFFPFFFVNRLGLTVAFFLYPFVDRFREEWEEDEEEEEEEVF